MNLPAFLNLAEYLGIVAALISCTMTDRICIPTIRWSAEAFMYLLHLVNPLSFALLATYLKK